MAALPSSRSLILACSATKRGGPKEIPAIDRYDGPPWRTLRAVDPNGGKAKVAFLSAHLGFRAANIPIEMYDARMTGQMAAAMKAGDLGTRWPRPKTQRRVMPSGEHPGMHISYLCVGAEKRAFRNVALVGGHLYLDVMRHLVDLFRKGGYVAADALITEINGPIGLMRQDLRHWLDRHEGETR
ncbi:hypothetical protein [Brucella intermedia]|uniref:hypothetical protein n=1 Tax=Brucella intermedia TaxID=94625 RepID=UPI00124DD8EE|nr:hypothetical protein [Brucella intermedia]KAB2723423.1 hypothetical protein F9L02_21945 [Brucella intermedia]